MRCFSEADPYTVRARPEVGQFTGAEVKVIARTDEYTIYQKRNERYAVKSASRAWVNGAEKVAILLEHKLIEAAAPKAPEPEASEETVAADEAATAEAPAEEPAAEDAEAESAADEEKS